MYFLYHELIFKIILETMVCNLWFLCASLRPFSKLKKILLNSYIACRFYIHVFLTSIVSWIFLSKALFNLAFMVEERADIPDSVWEQLNIPHRIRHNNVSILMELYERFLILLCIHVMIVCAWMSILINMCVNVCTF